MSAVRAILALAAALGLEAAIGRLAPGLHRFVDPLMVPVVWYALVRSQRSAMLAGFAAGWLQDAWFQAGLFGINGFTKTLLGWTLGGLGARFEMNNFAGRLSAGVLMVLADRLLQLGLLRLFDQPVAAVDWLELAIRSLMGGVLVLVSFALLERRRDRGPARRTVRRRA